MSQTHSIQATTRKRSGSAALKAMRREGFTPAVLYGAKQENINIKISAKQFTDLLQHSASENLLVNLEIEGEGGAKMALIQDVQHNSLTGAILHADFHAVSQNEKIHANVPLELTGTAVGVKEGGVLEHQVHSIQVHCFPKDLPSVITADISELEMGDSLHVGDLKLADGVSLHLEGGVVVAIVTEPRVGGESEEEGATATEAAAAGEGADTEEQAS